MYTYAIRIALSYRYTPRIEVVRTNCLASSLNIFIDKTPVPSSGIPFARPFVDRKLYYNSGLSLNESIDPTSTGL